VKITVLVENTTKNMALKPKHGLSLHIETPNHKVLFDVGSDDTYLCNASKLGVDVTEVDTMILSHGHKDHGGALSGFLKVNTKAKVYIHKKALEPHYIKVLFAKIYIGLDKNLAENERIVFTDDTIKIDNELFLFSNVEGQFDTKSQRVLLKKTANGYVRDDFAHEQNLIISTGDKVVLFSGCSQIGRASCRERV
jgi:7,8-dihydropterin-6-yl-methyl-4-(beta-D-ribofuranosyl)aminobenzene 5'-phosphate synthase